MCAFGFMATSDRQIDRFAAKCSVRNKHTIFFLLIYFFYKIVRLNIWVCGLWPRQMRVPNISSFLCHSRFFISFYVHFGAQRSGSATQGTESHQLEHSVE